MVSKFLTTAIIISVLTSCAPAPPSATSGSCTSPIANKAIYMLASLVDVNDKPSGMSFSFGLYNPPGQPVDAGYFQVPDGTYDLTPSVKWISGSLFSVTDDETGQFTGSNYGRPALIHLVGEYDSSTGAGDFNLTSDGKLFHLIKHPADISSAVAAAQRAAADINSQNWDDLESFANSYGPGLGLGLFAKTQLQSEIQALTGVASACRMGVSYFESGSDFSTLDTFYDVLAINVKKGAQTVSTFLLVSFTRQDGVHWTVESLGSPGNGRGSGSTSQLGIPTIQ